MKDHKKLTNKQRRYLGLIRKMLANDLTKEQFFMGFYVGGPNLKQDSMVDIEPDTALKGESIPCGTVGCIMGWAVLLIPEIRSEATECLEMKNDWGLIKNQLFNDVSGDLYIALFDSDFKSDLNLAIERVDYILENGIPTNKNEDYLIDVFLDHYEA